MTHISALSGLRKGLWGVEARPRADRQRPDRDQKALDLDRVIPGVAKIVEISQRLCTDINRRPLSISRPLLPIGTEERIFQIGNSVPLPDPCVAAHSSFIQSPRRRDRVKEAVP
jgi:hypothetical protein